MKWFCLKLLSSSSWGCELKFSGKVAQVTMSKSSSSWGCELKCVRLPFRFPCQCHPLREDVSWNSVRTNLLLLSVMSSSSWGCELKLQALCRESLQLGHPLREDVSWNVRGVIFRSTLSKSSSSWGCELKCDCLNLKTAYFNVILFVRMWVEIYFVTFS